MCRYSKRLTNTQALPLEPKDTPVATLQMITSTSLRVLRPLIHLPQATMSPRSTLRAAYTICAVVRSSSTRWTMLASLWSTLVVGSPLCLVSVSPMVLPAPLTSLLCGTPPGLPAEKCCQTWPRESFRCTKRYVSEETWICISAWTKLPGTLCQFSSHCDWVNRDHHIS